MGWPFSQRVAAEDWRREAETWARDRLAEQGFMVSGPIGQPRIRPWSTQLTIPTSAGTVWFKANCAAMAFEPLLQAELARLAPASVDVPLAIEPQRGWMLTADRGTTFGDRSEPTVENWRQVVTEAAVLQQQVADHGPALLAAGLPDCSPSTVVGRFDRLLETFVALPPLHPSHVPAELAARLRARRGELVDAADVLAGSAVAATWQHGDVHPWNVFDTGGSDLRIFDFGDSQWAHPVEILSVPYGWIMSQTSFTWAAVVGAYCEVWGWSAEVFDAAWRATALTQPVNRAVTWWTGLAEATAAEWQEWGNAPSHHLARMLDS